MSLAEVQCFFAAYRDAFDRLDGDAVADLWHTPSGITDTRPGAAQASVTVWTEDAPIRDNMRALCAAYAAAGYGRAEFEIVDHVPLGDHHAFVNLAWTLWRADGSLLQRFRTGYQLLRTAAGTKLLLVTAYEESLTAMKPHAAR